MSTRFPTPDVFIHILKFVQFLHHAPMPWNPFFGHHSFLDWNPTLVALAQTCKALSEPSLDLLWSTQVTLAPLMRTLGDDICVMGMETDEMYERRGKDIFRGLEAVSTVCIDKL